MLIPILLVALSLTGAPRSTSVMCGTVPQGEYGWSYWQEQEIVLDPRVCLGLEWMQADPWEQEWLDAHHGPLTYWAGVGALVMLHESVHVAGDHDETSTECKAMSLLPRFLSDYLTGKRYDLALFYAQQYDESLPALYHAHSC